VDEPVRYGPLVGKKLTARLRVAKRKYDRAIAVGDSDAAEGWLRQYQELTAKQAEMRARPVIQTFTESRELTESRAAVADEAPPIFSPRTYGPTDIAGMGEDLEDLLADDDEDVL
jgi:hypothetical protein